MIDARTPRAEAATAAVERFARGFDAALATVPDMSPDELLLLAEQANVLAAVIKTEQAEREWVRRNEH